jgi:hypothetical protein
MTAEDLLAMWKNKKFNYELKHRVLSSGEEDGR